MYINKMYGTQEPFASGPPGRTQGVIAWAAAPSFRCVIARGSTTMRLRRSVRQGLESLAERSRRSVSDLAEEFIAEGMRMRECPGIYFATEPSGRTAKVGGSGLAVWEVLRDFVEDEDAAGLREAFHWLSPAKLTAATMYFRRYPDEVRGQVEANRALTPEAVERLWPGLVRTV